MHQSQPVHKCHRKAAPKFQNKHQSKAARVFLGRAASRNRSRFLTNSALKFQKKTANKFLNKKLCKCLKKVVNKFPRKIARMSQCKEK